ncbi:ARM repeat-containing protein [Gonapodya prolifera JEL478]|uniref:ARM repeat-containing protein n=1 Tax=Gonapodya prolifera (strain JEL478) TaxID=1344416 RepID=A0A139APJ7_GONPJ|nr:ARM repeat-containing protein [Gonapodya prolifera JEL478]|eukprot:KXS18677.1 ARM repeat-containing protein [Gonapodya prolifera JEL478]
MDSEEELDEENDEDDEEDEEEDGEEESFGLEDDDEDGSELADEEDDDDVPASASEDDSDLEEGSEQDDDEESRVASEGPAADTPSSSGKYVPPHLRRGVAANTDRPETEADPRLAKTIQGLLNRLSPATLEHVFSGVEECYRTYPRGDVTATMSRLLIASSISRGHLLSSYVLPYVALASLLHRCVGADVASRVAEDAVEETLMWYEKPGGGGEGKEVSNLVTVVAWMYDFGIVSSVLIYDFVKMFIKSLAELDVELLLRVLKVAGFRLRGDDPVALKEIINLLNEEVKKREQGGLSTRTKFLLESVTDLKNNRRRNRKEGEDEAEQLKKAVQNVARKRFASGGEPLRFGLDDLKNAPTKGKWWLTGAAWTGHDSGETGVNGNTAPVTDVDVLGGTSSQALLALARKMRMNTDVRRSVFVVLMGSEDYVDAFEKLMKLNLKNKQEREIVRVLIHCCAMERRYNPYYSLLSNRLCGYSVSFKVTYQFTLWDEFKELAEVSDIDKALKRRIVNIAKLYGYLIAEGALALMVLKVRKC